VNRQILVGFDAIDVNNSVGKLSGSPCRLIGIVPATKENLGKISCQISMIGTHGMTRALRIVILLGLGVAQSR
jgi:hypothetical protein